MIDEKTQYELRYTINGMTHNVLTKVCYGYSYNMAVQELKDFHSPIVAITIEIVSWKRLD